MATSPWAEPGEAIRRGGVVAGVLSGTSADGIDVGLMRFDRLVRIDSGDGLDSLAAPEPLGFDTVPFGAELNERLRAVLDGEQPALGDLARLDRDLGRAFGRAAREVAARAGVPLALVGSHGQTVWHHDGEHAHDSAVDGRATLQLGCPDELAEAAGCAVAADFRRRDIAAGGEGAPLSALVDPLLFADVEPPYAVLNLGGIANLTLVDADGGVSAFDTGPAGSLLDGLARHLLARDFDRGGEAALAGRGTQAHRRAAAAFEPLLAHPFFARPAPKSTGRDTFGAAWVADLVERLAAEGDVAGGALAAGADFVAWHVAQGLGSPARADRPLIVAGGGVHNRALMDALAERHPGPVRSSADHGVHPDGREALVFGVLGARCALGLPSTAPGGPGGVTRGVTGAAPGRVLGRLVLPPPPAGS